MLYLASHLHWQECTSLTAAIYLSWPNPLSYGLANLMLITVGRSTINVPVARVQCS